MTVSTIAHVQSVYLPGGKVKVVRHSYRGAVRLDQDARLAGYAATNHYGRDRDTGVAKLTPRQLKRWRLKQHRGVR